MITVIYPFIDSVSFQGKAKEGSSSLVARYRTATDPPLYESVGPTAPSRSDGVNASGSPVPNTPKANGVVDGKDDENGRPKKRARTDDTDEEVFEGMLSSHVCLCAFLSDY